jgi:hypothetical protein
LFGNSESRSRRGQEADDLSKFDNPDPPPHFGGYIFQTSSNEPATSPAGTCHYSVATVVAELRFSLVGPARVLKPPGAPPA